MNEVRPPSSFTLQRVMSAAMSTLDVLRNEHGQIIEEDDVLASLAEEGIDLATVLDRLIAAALEAKAMAAAAGQRVSDLQSRKARFQRQEETYRATLQAVMAEVGLRKHKAAEASLTITDSRPSAIVTDLDALIALMPSLVRETTTLAPDKAAILAELALGPVPGALPSPPSTTLTIRPR
jgi:hypothetical protein